MNESLRKLRAYILAVRWRLGASHPTEINSYIRYVGAVDAERLSREVLAHVRRQCWIGGLRVVSQREVRHLPDDDAVRRGDSYGMVGSVAWRVEVI